MCTVHGSKFITSCSVLEGFECCACCPKAKEGCSQAIGEYDEIGAKITTEVHTINLRKIKEGTWRGYPYEDKEMAIMICGRDGINIDAYPELLLIRDLFSKCLTSEDYGKFVRATVNPDIIQHLDCFFRSKKNQKKSGHIVSL